jgi:hypothetical protein
MSLTRFPKNRKILAKNIDELSETLPRFSSAIKYNPPEGKSSKNTAKFQENRV